MFYVLWLKAGPCPTKFINIYFSFTQTNQPVPAHPSESVIFIHIFIEYICGTPIFELNHEHDCVVKAGNS